MERPIVEWSAAARELVATDALRRPDIPVFVTGRLDANKLSKCLECSAVRVVPPIDCPGGYGDTVVAVKNYRYINAVTKFLGARHVERVTALA